MIASKLVYAYYIYIIPCPQMSIVFTGIISIDIIPYIRQNVMILYKFHN